MKADEKAKTSQGDYTYFKWLKGMVQAHLKYGAGRAFQAECCLICDAPLRFVCNVNAEDGVPTHEVSCYGCGYRIVFREHSVH